jgi:membrane protease YdiL (CAAX protease family)
VLGVASILLVGPAEELLFRGAIQGRLRRAFGPVGAIVITSLLFVPLHLPTYSGSAIAIAAFMVIVFVASAVLGYVYERTGNLAINALIHGLYNAALAISAYLALVV